MPASKPEHPARRAAREIVPSFTAGWRKTDQEYSIKTIEKLILTAYSDRDRRVADALRKMESTCDELIEIGNKRPSMQVHMRRAVAATFKDLVRAALAEMEHSR